MYVHKVITFEKLHSHFINNFTHEQVIQMNDKINKHMINNLKISHCPIFLPKSYQNQLVKLNLFKKLNHLINIINLLIWIFSFHTPRTKKNSFIPKIQVATSL